MSKYDFELDLGSINSTSLVIGMLEPGSSVLEFGPAHGRLTKYLKEELNCSIDIIEIDQDSGRDAGKYADYKCVGELYGDANKDYWVEHLKERKYDYIIFEDVLEHLINPEKVLKNAVDKLKDNGSIIVSIPNISHSSIIVQLFNNEFMYQPLGLLDNTHIRFFTYYSFKRMISEIGLESVEEKATFLDTSNTEFDVSLLDVPREVAKALLYKEFGNVYQFILKLKKKSHREEVKEIHDEKLDLNTRYFIQCYWRNEDEFDEKKSFKKSVNPGNKVIIELPISSVDKVREIRVDPLNTNCCISISQIEVINNSENAVIIEQLTHNGYQIDNNEIFFASEDPQLLISISEETNISKIKIELEFTIYDVEHSAIWDRMFRKYEDSIRFIRQEMDSAIDSRDKIIKDMNRKLDHELVNKKEMEKVVKKYHELLENRCIKIFRKLKLLKV